MSASDANAALPIAALRASFLDVVDRKPVVVSSPTGSGKSTEIPRWCRAHAPEARVLVIEPRRVACRSLAARVADLEGTRLGDAVGYVGDNNCTYDPTPGTSNHADDAATNSS